MTLRFHPNALEEFQDAAHWYEDRSVLAGERFVKELRAATTSILSAPDTYPTAGRGVRVYRMGRFPFRLYYTFDTQENVVCIYAVMHEKMRPNYWRERLDEN